MAGLDVAEQELSEVHDTPQEMTLGLQTWHYTLWMENPGTVWQSCFPCQLSPMFISALDHCLPRCETAVRLQQQRGWDLIYTAGKEIKEGCFSASYVQDLTSQKPALSMKPTACWQVNRHQFFKWTLPRRWWMNSFHHSSPVTSHCKPMV